MPCHWCFSKSALKLSDLIWNSWLGKFPMWIMILFVPNCNQRTIGPQHGLWLLHVNQSSFNSFYERCTALSRRPYPRVLFFIFCVQDPIFYKKIKRWIKAMKFPHIKLRIKKDSAMPQVLSLFLATSQEA